MPATSRMIAVALGSNLGDRAAHLAFATSRLRGVLADLVVSQAVDTRPEGNIDQPAVSQRGGRRHVGRGAREIARSAHVD